MIKKWKGKYKYDSQKAHDQIGHSHINFTIEMEIFKDDTLKGTVQDDVTTSGMKEIGEISGEVYKNSIYFEKQMPQRSVIDLKTGKRESLNEKHPIIYYIGELYEENKYRGTWFFEKKWTFIFGFIPFKYCPGKGTWEMELANK